MVHLQLLAQICSFSFCDLVDACEILKMEGYVYALDEEPDAGVEDGEDLQILAEACHITLAKQDREIKKLNKQRDQAIKQARHWQAQAQQQRAKVCQLETENDVLMQWVIEYEDQDAKQQPGESFSQWEERQNFPPGVPLPSWPLSDFQGDPLIPGVPLPLPSWPLEQPVGPPPSYLIKRFQSQTSSSSSQKVLLGLNKAMPIGQKIVKKHAKKTWKRAPVP